MSYALHQRDDPKKVEEMIRGLAPIVKYKLEFFKKETKKEATKIVYFRDGVSEGQFQQVSSIFLFYVDIILFLQSFFENQAV